MDDLLNMDGNEGTANELEALEQQLETEKATAPELPEKYRGKSIEEIVRMHQEAEKVIGRQAAEVGEVRRLADQLILRQTQEKPLQTQPEVVDDVDFFANPKEAIAKAVAQHPVVQNAVTRSAELEKQLNFNRLMSKHPDFKAVMQEPDFTEYVLSSPIRRQLFQAADKNFDFDAADELFTTYKQVKQRNQETRMDGVNALKEEQNKQLKAASVDGGNTAPTGKKIFKRAELINLQIQNPSKYEAMQDEIYAAYAEGRVK